MSKTKYKILLVLFIIAFIASAILAFVPIAQACGSPESGCSIVNLSQYESTFGIKNAYFGLIAFFIIGFLSFLQIKKREKIRKDLIIYGVVFASIIAIYLLYIQFFVLHAICKYCMVIDSASLLSLAIVIFWKEKQ